MESSSSVRPPFCLSSGGRPPFSFSSGGAHSLFFSSLEREYFRFSTTWMVAIFSAKFTLLPVRVVMSGVRMELMSGALRSTEAFRLTRLMFKLRLLVLIVELESCEWSVNSVLK